MNNMMLSIEEMPPCGFGNRLLYYFNLRQEAYKRGCDFFCVPWDGYHFFEGNLLGSYLPNENYEVFSFCLAEKFYSYNKLSTRDVFKLKKIPSIKSDTCAVHFRGTDFHAWNPKSILKSQYYCDSIEEVKDQVSFFNLYTDDINLKSYKDIKNLLKSENISFSICESKVRTQHYINDFSSMSECDYIISSPSTFCISAGVVGKVKKIIHSKEWVMDRVEKKDKFWVDLYNGGNDDYKLWRLI